MEIYMQRSILLLFMLISFVSFSNSSIIYIKNLLNNDDSLQIHCRNELKSYGKWTTIPNKQTIQILIFTNILLRDKPTIRCYVQSSSAGLLNKCFTLYNPRIDEKECEWKCCRVIRNDAVYSYSYPEKGFTGVVDYEDVVVQAPQASVHE